MKSAPFFLAFAGALTLVVAACAAPTSQVSQPAAAPVAIDLGASSRVPRTARLAGEGEGYGTVQAALPVTPTSTGAMPGMDHGAMDHGVMPGMEHSAMPASPTPPAQTAQAQHAHVQGTGMVKAVDAAAHKVTLNHNAIPAIGWPAMTMEFAVDPSVDLQALKSGTRVDFTMMQSGDGMYVIHSMAPAAGGQ